MPLSKEQLLAPRYRVIAGYPHMELDQHGVGDIISPYGMGFVHPEKVKEQYDSYPHLFKRLQWWEERAADEVPEFLRLKETDEIFKAKFDLNTTSAYFVYIDDQLIPYHPHEDYWEPATLEEYTQYINSKQ